MILLSAFQALECLPVEVDDLDSRRDELDFRADLLLAHGSERCSAALAGPLIFWQGDELLFMREIFQDFRQMSISFLPALMRWYFNGGLRSTCFGLNFSLVEEIDFLVVAEDAFRPFSFRAECHLLQLGNLFLEILVFLFQVPFLICQGIYPILHLLLAQVSHGKPPFYSPYCTAKSPVMPVVAGAQLSTDLRSYAHLQLRLYG